MFHNFFQFLTVWGHIVAVAFIIFAVVWRVSREPRLGQKKRIREGAISLSVFALVTLVSFTAVKILKLIFPVARPFVEHGITPIITVGFFDSFPSGHAFILGALSGASWKFSKKLSIILGFVTLVVSIGRVYFGLHYISDIIFGMIVGLPLGYFLWWEIHKLDVLEKVFPKLK